MTGTESNFTVDLTAFVMYVITECEKKLNKIQLVLSHMAHFGSTTVDRVNSAYIFLHWNQIDMTRHLQMKAGQEFLKNAEISFLPFKSKVKATLHTT